MENLIANENSSNTKTPQKNNRVTLILTLFAFLLPVVLAYLFHTTGLWQARGTTNQGTLLSPPVDFDELNLSQQTGTDPGIEFERGQQWWIVYAIPSQCDKACINSLFQIRQTQIATGPEQDRVSMLAIQHENSDPLAAEWIQKNATEMVITQGKQAQLDRLLKSAALESATGISNAGQIFLVDPMGALFMTYPRKAEEQASILQGKGMLRDLQRVLKLSRIG